MKVVFKISQVQAMKLIALAAASVQNAKKDAEFFNDKLIMCGDFATTDTGYGVAQQSLVIGDDSLTYEGTRTALVGGSIDAMAVILKVFGELETATKYIVSVKSSAPHLKWYETEADALNRCPADRLVELATHNNEVGRDAKTKLQKNFGAMLTMSPVKLAAQYNSSEIAEFQKACKVLS